MLEVLFELLEYSRSDYVIVQCHVMTWRYRKWRHSTLLSVYGAVVMSWHDWWSVWSSEAFPGVQTASTTTMFNCDLCVGSDVPGCWLVVPPATLPPLPPLLAEFAMRRRTTASPARIVSRPPVAYLDGVSLARRPIPGTAADGAGLRLSASPGSQYVLLL